MCLAIYKPANAIIPVEHLENGYHINDDGCGFCYAENGKIHVVKGLLSFKDFYRQYREKEHLAMLIHFRMSTHAGKNQLNCHPFTMCDGNYALIHNGVIAIHCSVKELSDTGNFAKLVMEPMLKAGIHPRKPSFFFLVEQAVGSNNKICLMDNQGNVTIYNEDSGDYEDAVDKNGNKIFYLGKDGKKYNVRVWYSNGGYKWRRRSPEPTRNYQDEYSGYFDGGVHSCGIAEMTTSIGEGFSGVPKTNANTQFTRKPPLDAPPLSTIEGFKPSGEKSAELSANAMSVAMAAGMPVTSRKLLTTGISEDKKQTIRIILPPKLNTPKNEEKSDDKSHSAMEVKSGPVFDTKTEVEISYLTNELNMTREDAIKNLQLESKDAIAVI